MKNVHGFMEYFSFYNLAGHLMTCDRFISAKEAHPVENKIMNNIRIENDVLISK